MSTQTTQYGHVEIYNPHNKNVEELPVVYGFNNGDSFMGYHAQLLAADGTPLGGHLCSDESFMPHDLGIVKGSRPDRHNNDIRPHYPDGYRMEFVPSDMLETHEGFKLAIAAANNKGA